MELVPLKPTDKRLRLPSDPVSLQELRTVAFQTQIDKLLNYVYGNNPKGNGKRPASPITVGLSANQMGINKQICIVDLAIDQRGFHDIHVLINPKIIERSKASQYRSEGCVNLPTIWGPVKRASSVVVKAMDRSGNGLVLSLSGWAAVLAQHEIDHLSGKLFIDHLQDPHAAHLVTDDQFAAYNKKSAGDWKHTVDVTDLLAHG